MKTLVKMITAYSFNELEEYARDEAKKKILEYDRLPEFFSEDLTEILKADFGLHNLKTYYSLSYCQGDGLCLCGKITFDELFDNKNFKKIAFKGIHHKQIQSIYNVLHEIDFKHQSRYYYANSIDIESYEYNPTDKQMAIIDKVIKNVKTWYFSFCREWEKRGYEYFYEMSDDVMKETCWANDYLFTENGSLINQYEYSEAV
ncbi:MAG: hypothetical protein FWC41_09925 [Firmicutes bacterium]|nr:hypothetical protein [Bacillota bacterium]